MIHFVGSHPDLSRRLALTMASLPSKPPWQLNYARQRFIITIISISLFMEIFI